MMVSLFEKLNAGRPPPPTEKAVEHSSPIEKLLDWLVNYWPEPTITAQKIYTYGPNCVRDKKTTLSLAQSLVERGWLVPLHPHNVTGRRRRDKREWKIGGRARFENDGPANHPQPQ
jgi:hypothetical protein